MAKRACLVFYFRSHIRFAKHWAHSERNEMKQKRMNTLKQKPEARATHDDAFFVVAYSL